MRSHVTRPRGGLPACSPLLVALLLLAAPSSLPAQRIAFGAPAPVNSHAFLDGELDESPCVATDRAGVWIVAWHSTESLGDTIGADHDVLFSRSSDHGTTWTPAAPLNTNAATDGPVANDALPTIATDGIGTWIAVWVSTNTFGGDIGSDMDLLVTRSQNDGATWTDPVPLNGNASTDSGDDSNPVLATDGAGNWVVVWRSFDSLDGTIGDDWDILVARSSDHGETWTAPAALDANASGDTSEDRNPHLATDGAGTWVVVWESRDFGDDPIGFDWDILVARSSDHGATWSAPAPLNTTAFSDAADDRNPRLATDGAGVWVAAWDSSLPLAGPLDFDLDILVARSLDAGATWSAPAALNSTAASDAGSDQNPSVATDRAGRWIAVWQSTESSLLPIGEDVDILWAQSTDGGTTWGPAAALNANAADDSGSDRFPKIATGAGRWIVVWESDDTLDGTIGSDDDILFVLGRAAYDGSSGLLLK